MLAEPAPLKGPADTAAPPAIFTRTASDDASFFSDSAVIVLFFLSLITARLSLSMVDTAAAPAPPTLFFPVLITASIAAVRISVLLLSSVLMVTEFSPVVAALSETLSLYVTPTGSSPLS